MQIYAKFYTFAFPLLIVLSSSSLLFSSSPNASVSLHFAVLLFGSVVTIRMCITPLCCVCLPNDRKWFGSFAFNWGNSKPFKWSFCIYWSHIPEHLKSTIENTSFLHTFTDKNWIKSASTHSIGQLSRSIFISLFSYLFLVSFVCCFSACSHILKEHLSFDHFSSFGLVLHQHLFRSPPTPMEC